MVRSRDAIVSIGREFGELTGRGYGLLEAYRMDDAEYALVVLGSTAGTAKYVINELRKDGEKCGLVKMSFPSLSGSELSKALGRLKAVGIMDRSDSFSSRVASFC